MVFLKFQTLINRRQLLAVSIISALSCVSSSIHAEPVNGQVMGGAGSISQSGLNTTIQQNSASLAINWDSFNLGQNEVVNFLQPNTSSIALNRILSSNGSQIHGQINANGQVVLVNPNGLFFGQNASVNVGGLIASGLDIKPADFMNSDYVFHSLEGTGGAVINSGLMNASLGGSIALLGQRVENNGFISATLGTVNLAAGKEAIATFDDTGVIGIRVKKEVLQEEFGVDPAIINNGEIKASGGRVLLTASVSQDLFSQAVNSGDINQATSVVMHDDGSFTLGGGADLVNTGSVDVSTTVGGQNGGQVVLLGENITSSGAIKANSLNGIGGDIEIHAYDTTMLNESSETTATSSNINGGSVKVLGDKVGIFDQSVIDVSGALDGGQVLIGGDFQGQNSRVRNSSISYVGEESTIKANSMSRGNGGTVIQWADNTARFYGSIQAKGGLFEGDGGFAEISGKNFLAFSGLVNLGADHGITGTLLLDPENITIQNGGTDVVSSNDAFNENPTDDVIFDADLITDILTGNGSTAANVVLQARKDIWVNEAITVGIASTQSLTMTAYDDIQIDQNISLTGGALTLTSNASGCTGDCSQGGVAPNGGDVGGRNIFLNADLSTNGANISLSGENIAVTGSNATRQLSTGSAFGGDIDLTGTVVTSNTSSPNSLTVSSGTGDVTFNNAIGNSSDFLSQLTVTNAQTVNLAAVNTGDNITITASSINLSGDVRSDRDSTAGNISLSGDVIINNDITIDSDRGNNTSDGFINITGSVDDDNDAGNVSRTLRLISKSDDVSITQDVGNSTALGSFIIVSADNATFNAINTRDGGVSITATNIDLGGNIDTTSGTNSGLVDINGAVSLSADISINTDSTVGTDGTVDFSSTVNTDAAQAALSTPVIYSLSIDAGDADVTISGEVGGIDRPSGITVSQGGAISLAAVNTGASGLTLNGSSLSFGTIDTNAGIVDLDSVSNLQLSNSINTSGGDVFITVTDSGTGYFRNDANDAYFISSGDGSVNITTAGNDGGNNRGVRLGAITTTGSGALNVIATNGEIVQSTDTDRNLVIAGTSSFDAGTNSITLNNSVNNFMGDVSFTTSSDVAVTDSNSITLGNAASSSAGVNNLSVTASNGGISQLLGAALDVDGVTSLTSSNGTIVVDNSGNDFTGLVNVTNTTGANDITIRDDNDITPGTASLSGGVYTVNAGNDITIDGSTSFDLNNSDSSLQLNANNNIDITSWTVSNFGSLSSTFNSTSGQINLNTSDVLSSGDAAINFNAPVVLQQSTVINSGIGKIDFMGTLSGANDRGESLSLTAGDIDFDNTVGSTRLGDISITASGAIDATGNSITANSLGITGSTSFSSASIDTVGAADTAGGNVDITSTNSIAITGNVVAQGGVVSGNSDGALGGAVDLTAASITTGLINTSGSDAAGTDQAGGVGGNITLTAVESGGVHSITVNNDLITSGGQNRVAGVLTGSAASGAILLDLSNANTPAGSVSILHTGSFLADINVSGSSGSDSLSAPDIATNTWLLDSANGGNLNTNIIFTDIENLVGNSQSDDFSFGLTGSIGTIDGNGGANLITGKNDSNLWTLTGTNEGNVAVGVTPYVSLFSDIQVLEGGVSTDTLTGQNTDSSWVINAANSGYVEETGPVDRVNFSNMENLEGGTSADVFTIASSNMAPALSIDGGTSAGVAQYDTLVGPNIATTWTVDTSNSLVDSDGVANPATYLNITFSEIENLTSGTEDDTFSFAGTQNVSGVVDAGNGTDSIDYSGFTDPVVFDLTNALTGRVNFENVTGNGANSTLIATDIVNTWDIDASNSGVLNPGASQLSFTSFANLTGGSDADTFNFTTVLSDITGLIDGESGTDIDVINLAAQATTVQLATAGVTGNSILEVNNIENIVANSAVDTNELIGADVDTNWYINASGSGSMGGGTLTTSPTEGTVMFSNFDVISAGTAADTFYISANTIATAFNINGGVGNDQIVNQRSVDSTWNLTSTDAGNLDALVNFTGIVNISGSDTNIDQFNLAGGSISSGVDGGNNVTDIIVNQLLTSTSWDINGNNQVTVAGTNFSDVENLTGADAITDNFTLQQAGLISGNVSGGLAGADRIINTRTSDTTWSITNLNQGSVTNITSFSGIENLSGSNNSDFFIVNGLPAAIALDGGAGTDSLTGFSVLNTWTINGSNAQSLSAANGGTIVFDDIENLVGGTSNDDFNFSLTGQALSVSGNGGTNSISGLPVTSNWILNAANSGSVAYITSFNDIQVINGGSGTDTLTGRNNNNQWLIDSNSFNYVEQDVATPTDRLIFSGMENLTGGSGDDVFTLVAGDVPGVISGGGSINDSLVYNITDSSANNWTISGPDSGQLVSLASTYNFTGIESIRGSDDADTFTLANSNYIENINGGNDDNVLDGNDTVDFGSIPGSFTAVLGTNLGFVNIDQFQGNSSNPERATLQGANSTNVWNITGVNAGTINGFSFIDFANLTGGTSDDSFQFSADTLNTPVYGTMTGLVNGGGGNDVVNLYTPANLFNAAVAIPVTVQLEGVVDLVTPDNGYIDVINVENLNANSSVVNGLRGGNGANNWVVTGNQMGAVNTTTNFDGFRQYTGGADVDTWVITSSLLSDQLNIIGGTGSNVLVGPSVDSNWQVTGSDSGRLLDNDVSAQVDVLFSSVGNLTGQNDVNDQFTIADGGLLSGTINAGTGSGLDSLISTRTSTTNWNINSTGGGSITGAINFSAMENLTGSAAIDNFTFNSPGVLEGLLNGGAGVDQLVLGAMDTDVQLAASTGVIGNSILETVNIESVSANVSFVNELLGDNAGLNWFISSAGSGSVGGSSLVTVPVEGSVIFNNFDTLTAGSGDDTFYLASNNVASLFDMDGGSGTNTLVNTSSASTTWNLTAVNIGNVDTNSRFFNFQNLSGSDSQTDSFMLAGGSNSGIVNGGVNTSDEIVNLSLSNTDWMITGNNQGSITSVISSFTGIENLTGSDSSNDRFYISSGSSVTGQVFGGSSGDDEIISQRTSATIWNITDLDQGSVTGIGSFIQIENLTGNNQDDQFNYTTNSASMSGLVNGGVLLASETDTDLVDMSLMTIAVSVTLGSEFLNIERFIGNENATLVAQDLNNQWEIFTLNPTIVLPEVANQGTVLDQNNNLVTFSGFNNITGGTEADNFLIRADGDITGTITGGTNPGDLPGNPVAIDTIDLSALAVVDKTVENALSGLGNVEEIEGINGNSTASILRAGDSGSIWTITGNNSGTVNSNGDITSFTGFNILQGGTGVDVFTVEVTGSLGDQLAVDTISRINGGAGDDTVNISLAGGSSILTLFDGDGQVSADDLLTFSTVNLSGTDSLIINGASANFDTATFSINYAANPVATHDFVNSTAPSSASVSYTRVESVEDYVQAGNLVITGEGNNNSVTLSSNGNVGEGQFVIGNLSSSFSPVSYQNKAGLSVRDLGNAGLITLSDSFNLDTNIGIFDFSADQINVGVNLLTANELRLDSVLTDLSSPVLTDISRLQVTSSAANIDIQETNDIILEQVDTTRSLSITAMTGDIDDSVSQGLTSTGDLSLMASDGSILLDNVNNALTGMVSLNTGNSGSVFFDNSGSTTITQLGASNVGTGSFTVNSLNASINGAQTLVANTAVFNAGTSDISLSNSNNDFDIVEISSAESVSIVDTDDLQLGNISAGSGILNFTSTAVSQSAGTSITQTANVSGSTGMVTFNAGTGEINLANPTNDFIGDLILNNTGNQNVAVADSNSLQLGASNVGSGTFDITIMGSITQSGAVIQQANAGLASFNAGSAVITLNNTNNDFTGPVSLINTGTFNSSLINSTSINMAATSTGGNLDVVALNAGDIVQSDDISVSGIASFSADNGQSIILDNLANNFQQTVSANSNSGGQLQDVLISNNTDLMIDSINVSNQLGLVVNGNVSGTGNMIVGSVAWIDSSGNSVTFESLANDFNEIVFIDASNVSIVDSNGLTLGTTAAATVPYTVNTDSMVSGDLTVTSLSGDIADIDSSSLSVAGVTTLNAGSGLGNVILDAASNDFGSVNIVNAQNVTLTDLNSINIESAAINGDLFVMTAGSIFDNNAGLNVQGTSSFTAGSGESIILDSAANSFNSLLSFGSSGSLADISLNNTGATDLAGLDVSNNLTVTSGAGITQTGGFNVGNNTVLTAVDAFSSPQNITLASVNDLNNLSVANAHDVTINNGTNALNINQMNATGLVDITSGNLIASSVISGNGIQFNTGAGSATFNGDVISASTIQIVSTGITLNGQTNSNGDASLDASTADVSINDSVTVASGNLSVTGGNILQNGIMTVQNGQVSMTGQGSIILNDQINAGQSIDLSTSTSSIAQNANLTSASNGISLNSAQDITMQNGVSSVSSAGDINYSAQNNIGVGLLQAQNSEIVIDAVSGQVTDINNGAANFIGDKLTLRSATGVGSNGSSIDSQVAQLDVINSGNGSIWMNQAGAVELINLQSEFAGNGIDFRANSTISLNPGSVAVNRDSGDLFMSTASGDFLGLNSFEINNADITAFNATFLALSGTFGTTGRPIVMDVPQSGSVLIDARTTSFRFFPETPDNLITTGIDVSSLGVISAIAGEQLVEIESLGDIDPAIFTELKNYSLQDVSIRLPRDQLFEDELEEEEKVSQAF